MGRAKAAAKAESKKEDEKPLLEKAEEKKEEPKEEEKVEDPPVVKQLKEIDDKYLEIEKEYEREVQKLLNEYTRKQQPLLEERRAFLTKQEEGAPATGTPVLAGFWLKAMQNHPAFEDILQEWDEPVLQFLQDIEKEQNEEDNSKGFKLKFTFAENPYFENTVLEKEYITEETNPYCGEIGVKEIKATTIEWKAGKNVTVEKVVKKVKGGGAKKQKQKGKEKEEPRPSFFREFFRNLKEDMELPEDAKEQARSMLEDEEQMDDEEDDDELLEYLMDGDHELGTAFRDNIVPFAIRWYTGEAAPEFEPGMDDEESEEEDDEEESEEESDDEPPKARGRGGPKASAKKQGKAKGGDAAPGDAPKEECKQQ